MSVELLLLKSYSHYSRRSRRTNSMPRVNRSADMFDRWRKSFSMDPFCQLLDEQSFIEHPCSLEYLDSERLLMVGQNWRGKENEFAPKGTVVRLKDKSTQTVLNNQKQFLCYLNVKVCKQYLALSSERHKIFWLELDKMDATQAYKIRDAPQTTPSQDLPSSQMFHASDPYFLYVTNAKEIQAYSFATTPPTECEFETRQTGVFDIWVHERLLYVLNKTEIVIFELKQIHKTGRLGKKLHSVARSSEEEAPFARLTASNHFLYVLDKNTLQAYQLTKKGRHLKEHCSTTQDDEAFSSMRSDLTISNLEVHRVQGCELLFIYMRNKPVYLWACVKNKLVFILSVDWKIKSGDSRILGAKFIKEWQSVVVYGESGIFRGSKIKWDNK